MLWVFSMFIKNLECLHGCNMENFPAASTRVVANTITKQTKHLLISVQVYRVN